MSRAKISIEDVRHVAALARLELEPDEELRFAGELEAILEYVDELSEVDTAGVSPGKRSLGGAPKFRDDVVRNEPAVEAILSNAPDPEGGFFRVPKIIE